MKRIKRIINKIKWFLNSKRRKEELRLRKEHLLKFPGYITNYEPKRENRFLISLPDDFNNTDLFLKSITYPLLKGDTWSNIELTFGDCIGPSVSQVLFILLKEKYNLSKKKYVNNEGIFTFNLYSLDPTGVIIEDWTITVEDIIEVNFGTGNYNSDEVKTVSLIIKPLNCFLNY